VNLGQYVAGCGELVTLQSLNPIHVNFGVPQQSVAQIPVGRSVRITTNDAAGSEWTGRVSAIDSKVDEATRNIQIQATLANPDGRLRPGMFVQAEVARGQRRSRCPSAVSYAPFGDSVFVVAELKGPDGSVYRGVRQQFVKLGPSRGDLISVLSGVKAGDEVVTSGVFKLRNGAAVLVNNKVQPGNNPSPKPENS
jgi:membrane fusion protein (multidrug efflux system)